MKEVPIPLIRANQWVMVLGTFISIATQSTIILTIVFLIALSPVLLGSKGNLVFRLAKPLLQNKLVGAQTEEIELQRFNSIIAVMMIGVSLAILESTGHWIGWLFAGIVTVAATLAINGFCIGCVIYFQWKQWKYKLRS